MHRFHCLVLPLLLAAACTREAQPRASDTEPAKASASAAAAAPAPDFKLTERIAGDPSEYYHLKDDPGEEHNLWDHPDANAEKLKQRLHAYFDSNADPRFDLWHGGKSKAKPHVFPKP